MATRSTITVKNEDGSYDMIYCHFDGYPSHVGRLLASCYNTNERAKALIALGSLSVLAESIEKPEGHDFEHPVEGYTIAYHRDRGDDLRITKGSHYKSLLRGCGEEYNYLWDCTAEAPQSWQRA